MKKAIYQTLDNYLSKKTSRRDFIQAVTAMGFTSMAAESLLASAQLDMGSADESGPSQPRMVEGSAGSLIVEQLKAAGVDKAINKLPAADLMEARLLANEIRIGLFDSPIAPEIQGPLLAARQELSERSGAPLVVRSSALAIREIPYVDAARTLGFNHKRIILRHMVPNVMAPYLIMLTTFMGQAILLEASLSYLGLGVQEPTPAWGLMLQGGAEEYAESAPWIPIFPGLAITIGVFAFNLFGDALRDTLDPRLRSQ